MNDIKVGNKVIRTKSDGVHNVYKVNLLLVPMLFVFLL